MTNELPKKKAEKAKKHISDKDVLVEVQDNIREMQLRTLFNLRSGGTSRIGHDARDNFDNPFELKTTTKNSVTTARDVGPHTLEKWRGRYWICAKGRNMPAGFVIEEIYFLSPSMMKEWIDSIEARFKPDLELLESVLDILRQSEFETSKEERLEYLVKRGITLNNPKISWHYVKSNGIQITANHARRLRHLVRQNPL